MHLRKSYFVLIVLLATCAPIGTQAPVMAQAPKKPVQKPRAAAAKQASSRNPGQNSAIWLYVAGGALLLAGAGALALRGKKPSSVPVIVPGDNNAWRALAEASGVGYAETNGQGEILKHNIALTKILGGSELRNLSLERFTVPENALQLKDLFEQLRDGRIHDFGVEYAFYRQDGRPFQGKLTVAKNSGHGAFAGLFLEDVTARFEAQRAWQESRAAIHDLTTVIAGETQELSEKLTALLAMGCRRFGLETGVLAELIVTSEPSTDALPRSVRAELVQVVSPDERIRRGRAYEIDVISGNAAGAPPGLADLTRLALSGDGRPQQAINNRGTVLGVIVTTGGQIYGVLNFSSITARPAPYGESDLELLQLMAQWVGGEIERSETRASLDARQKELETKQMELLAANAQLEALATTDGLTGVKNRRSFDQRMEEEFARARRYSTPLSLLLLDVDKFKDYNDTFGHPAGDEVLRQVARILQEGIRATDFVARYGGEEFALILPSTDSPGAMILADRLRFRIQQTPWPHREVTASVGVSSFRGDMKALDELTSTADAALYASKEGGRNRVTHAKDMKNIAVNQEKAAEAE